MISDSLLDEVGMMVDTTGFGPELLATLRSRHSGVHFTQCMEGEVGADEPVRDADTYSLYLVDGREHCMRLTRDAKVATGLLVAEK